MTRKKRRRREQRELARHVFERQIVPHLKGNELRQDGVNVENQFVYTGDDELDGYIVVSCGVCGRSAQMPASSAPTEGQVPVCPDCIDTYVDGEEP